MGTHALSISGLKAGLGPAFVGVRAENKKGKKKGGSEAGLPMYAALNEPRFFSQRNTKCGAFKRQARGPGVKK